ncbi:hypothetical protein BCR44DRAFT_1432168, partial [Catenaria anguillulae PL171]
MRVCTLFHAVLVAAVATVSSTLAAPIDTNAQRLSTGDMTAKPERWGGRIGWGPPMMATVVIPPIMATVVEVDMSAVVASAPSVN